jgi:hypothetical protein
LGREGKSTGLINQKVALKEEKKVEHKKMKNLKI